MGRDLVPIGRDCKQRVENTNTRTCTHTHNAHTETVLGSF